MLLSLLVLIMLLLFIIFLLLGTSSIEVFELFIDEKLSKERSSFDETSDLFTFSWLIIINMILYDKFTSLNLS